MKRNLDTDDMIRELKGQRERWGILLASDEFKWFLAHVESRLQKVRESVIDKRMSQDDYAESFGEARAYKRVLRLAESEHKYLKTELEAMGVVTNG